MGTGGWQAETGRRRLTAAAGDVRALAVAFGAGVLAIETAPVLPAAGWFVAALILCLPRWGGRTLLLVLVLGAAWATWTGHRRLGQRLPVAADGRIVTLTGHIASLPERGRFRTRFEFVSNARPRRMRLSWYEGAPMLHPGDCWRLTLKLSAPHGSLNPGAFDYEAWLWRHRIGATGYIKSAQRCGNDRWSPDRWRQALSRRIDRALHGAPMAAFLRALTVGDRAGITDAQWRVLRRTGTSHLVAISGLHIGLLAALVFFLARWLLPRLPGGSRLPVLSVAAVLTALLAAGYAVMAGLALPTERALLMIAVVLGAVLLRRRTAPSRLLALAAFAVLIIDPTAVLAVGFWLSFGAVAWILYLLTGRIGGGQRWRWLLLQLGLVLGLMPLALFWFGQASLVAPIANTLLIPAFAVVVPAVLIATLMLVVWPAVGQPLLQLVVAVLGYGWHGLQWLAAWPFSHVLLPTPSLWVLVAALVGTALLLAPRGLPGRWLGLFGLLALLLPAPAPPPGGFRLTVLDVGQGLSAVVRTAHHVLLFDTGPRYRSGFNAGSAIVVPYLRSQGIARIDQVIISHPDIDHSGGWPAVQRALPVTQAMGADVAQPCWQGMVWRWDGVTFRMLHPDSAVWRDNNRSCVLRISGAGGSALLTGDIERGAERRLLADERGLLAADIVVMPHHGSRSSSSAGFVRAVDATWAVAPAGWHNRWHFPAPIVVKRYRAAGARVLQTGRDGAIRFDIDPHRGISPPLLWRRRVDRFWRVPRPD